MKIGILGYGKLGKAVEKEAEKDINTVICGIFSDENIKDFGTYMYHTSEIIKFVEIIDVLIICEAEEKAAPYYSGFFNTVDAYSGNMRMLEYFDEVDRSAKSSSHSSVVAANLNTGINSLYNAYFDIIYPKEAPYVFAEKRFCGEDPDCAVTARIMLTYAKAAYRQYILGAFGAFTVFDFKLKDLSRMRKEELIEEFL